MTAMEALFAGALIEESPLQIVGAVNANHALLGFGPSAHNIARTIESLIKAD